MTKVYISLVAEAELALQAAAGRLEKAKLHFVNFVAEHVGPADSRELAKAWQREQDQLATELDEATRFYAKCKADLAALGEGEALGRAAIGLEFGHQPVCSASPLSLISPWSGREH